MTRHIKVLGLALIAIFAMSAVAAGAAQAEPVLSTEGGVSVELMGEQTEGSQVFTVDGSQVTCKKANFEPVGETANGATWGTLHPEYSECTAFGFLGATVTTTGCNYEAMATGASEEVEGMKRWNSGQINVVCSAGNHITVHGGTCTATVGAQELKKGISFTNTDHTGQVPNMDFDIITNGETEVHTNKTEDGFGCPFNGVGETIGTIVGKTTVRATHPKGTFIGVTVA